MIEKFLGGGKLQRKATPCELLIGFVGGAVGISSLLTLTYTTGYPIMMAPFGTTCVLLFAAPQSPLAQPRNVVFGHLISSLVGLIFINFFGDSILCIGLATGSSIVIMQFLRCVHPPAGADPALVIMTGVHGFSFLMMPVLLGSIVLVFISLIINNIGEGKKWPVYWLGK